MKAIKHKAQKILLTLSALVLAAHALAIPATQVRFSRGEPTPVVTTGPIDILDGQSITTSTDETRELILNDGSVVAIGLDSQVTFRVTDNQLENIVLVQGSLRITSGPGEAVPVSGRAYSGIVKSQIGNASGVFKSDPAIGFTIAMVYGDEITVSHKDTTFSLVKPGFSVTFSKTGASANQQRPVRLAVHELEGLLLPTQTDSLLLGSSGSLAAGSGEIAPASGNEDEITAALADDVTEELESIVVADRGDPVDVNPFGSLGPGGVINLSALPADQPSQANGDDPWLVQVTTRIQNAGSVNDWRAEAFRNSGRGANRFYNINSGDNSQDITNNAPPVTLQDPDNSTVRGMIPIPTTALTYAFVDDEGLLSFDIAGIDTLTREADFDPGNTFDISGGGPIIFRDIDLPGSGEIYSNTVETITGPGGGGGPFDTASSNSLLAAGFEFRSNPNHTGAGGTETNAQELYRAEDNFLFFQAKPGQMDGAAVVLDPNATTTYFFATGDLDGRLPVNGFTGSQFSVDQFHLGSGITACADDTTCSHTFTGTVEAGIRAFARNQTTLGLDLTDSGLLVVNQAAAGTDDQTAVLHVDFGLEGAGASQSSTVSATIGDLRYETVTFSDTICDTNACEAESIEVSAEGKTIGSSRSNTSFAGFTSPFRVTAAGGGNPLFNRQGYTGYLVLENYDPEPQFANGNASDGIEDPISGGTEFTVGNSLDEANHINYAQLRLATANGNTSEDNSYVLTTRSDNSLNGWMGGLTIREENGQPLQLRQIDSDLSPDNFSINTDAGTNRISATANLYDEDNPGTLRTLQLGGLTGDASKGASAFVDDDRFAARTLDSDTDANAALISSALVADALPDAAPEYEHIKWGFFFGDVVSTDTVREHVHMGTWVAGEQSALADIPGTGTASYSGHATGDVYNNGANYIATGTFTNSWDFGTRRGTAAMSFDEINYAGQTEIIDGSVAFQGRLDADNREGALHGNFVQGGGDPVAGVVGRFSISNTGGTLYRASGTFAGEK